MKTTAEDNRIKAKLGLLKTINDKIVWTMDKWFQNNSNLSGEKYQMLKEIVKACHG